MKIMADYWTKTTRSMLSEAKEVGGMPFMLFQYYLTWASAPEGIKPTLARTCEDLGLEKSAVCNLRKKLIEKGWIRLEKDEVFITKSFTKNECCSQKMKNDSQKVNDYSQKMNEPFTKSEQSFTKNESPYKEEKEQERTIEKEQEEREGAPAPAQFQSSVRNLGIEESQHKKIERRDDLKDCKALNFFENCFKVTVGNVTATAISDRVNNLAVWENLIRDKIGFADEPLSKRNNIKNWIFTAYEERLQKLSSAKTNSQKNAEAAQEVLRRRAIKNAQQ